MMVDISMELHKSKQLYESWGDVNKEENYNTNHKDDE